MIDVVMATTVSQIVISISDDEDYQIEDEVPELGLIGQVVRLRVANSEAEVIFERLKQ